MLPAPPPQLARSAQPISFHLSSGDHEEGEGETDSGAGVCHDLSRKISLRFARRFNPGRLCSISPPPLFRMYLVVSCPSSLRCCCRRSYLDYCRLYVVLGFVVSRSAQRSLSSFGAPSNSTHPAAGEGKFFSITPPPLFRLSPLVLSFFSSSPVPFLVVAVPGALSLFSLA